MGKQYLTEHAIIFLEKSSGLSWNYPNMNPMYTTKMHLLILRYVGDSLKIGTVK